MLSIYKGLSKDSFLIFLFVGVLSTTSPLDHESIARHELTIMVRDQGLTSQQSLARVVVIVRDANDHAPEFVDATFTGSVFETAAPGSSVAKVTAIDRDHGSNAEIVYSITSGECVMTSCARLYVFKI